MWQSGGVTPTKTKKVEEAQPGGKAQTEPPWNLILHNSWHPMSWVIYVLVKTIPGTTIKKAAKIMWEARTKGKAVAKTCQANPSPKQHLAPSCPYTPTGARRNILWL